MRRSTRKQHPAGVYVEGLDDVMVRLSKCCTPVPGDAILGFVTRGRGVSVHRVDCSNAASLPEELEASAWTEEGVVMGLRHRTLPAFGVQFHPESILTPEGPRLLRNFLEVAT